VCVDAHEAGSFQSLTPPSSLRHWFSTGAKDHQALERAELRHFGTQSDLTNNALIEANAEGHENPADEQDQIVSIAVTNDPAYVGGELWGMYGEQTGPANQYGSGAGEAWLAGYTGASSVVVGVVDTGIDYTHPDLFLNIWLNQAEIPAALRLVLNDVDGDGLIGFLDLNSSLNSLHVSDSNGNGRIDAGDLLNDIRWEDGADTDTNGFIDDLIGWDFVNHDNDPYDDQGHGTHVAGTIAATGNNGSGVAGVGWHTQLVALKFLSSTGSGSLGDAISALDYFTTLAAASEHQDFAATNNSWGGGDFSQLLLDAIVRGAKEGILFVAAAGNGGSDRNGDDNDSFAQYPSNYDTTEHAGYNAVLSVASLAKSGLLSSFSNFGAASVHLAAPGSSIISTLPGEAYGSYSGTSMATPHVAGAIALYSGIVGPGIHASEIRTNLLSSTGSTLALAGKTSSGGRLDVSSLVFTGTTANDVRSGSSLNETFRLAQGGDDSASGGGGNDQFYYGAAFTAADLNDGGAGTDVVVLQGNYAVTMGAGSLVGVEFLSLQSGSSTRYGESGTNSYSYDVGFVDANVAAGQRFTVNASQLLADESFTFNGSAETDGSFLVYGGFGADRLTGGSGNDVFHFEGSRWGSGDVVDGGAGAGDSLVLRAGGGMNSIVFGEAQLNGIESISVSDRFGLGAGGRPSYDLTLADGNVAAGGTLVVNGNTLSDASQQFNVDGSAVVRGNLRFFGGAGDDRLIGGAGNDLLYAGGGRDSLTGGAGADSFQLRSLSDSTVSRPDEILDFSSGMDKIDLRFLDADASTAGDQAFSFVGAAAFSGNAGELRAYDTGAGHWTVEGDVNGDGVADFALSVTLATPNPLVSSDIIV
jgi:subtilisin family serine protease